MSEYRPILSERPEDILKAIAWAREEQGKILNEKSESPLEENDQKKESFSKL